MTVHVELLPSGPAYLYVPLKLPAHAGLAGPTATPAKTTDTGRPGASTSAFVQVEVVPPGASDRAGQRRLDTTATDHAAIGTKKCSSRMKAVGQSWCAAMATRTVLTARHATELKRPYLRSIPRQSRHISAKQRESASSAVCF